jgi:ribosomal protein S3
MIQYLVADSARLLDKPLHLYQAAIRMGLLSGEVHTTPGINGVAVWISPGHTDFTFVQLLRSGF